MMYIKEISLWTALVTPLDEDNKIDLESIENLLMEQDKAGNGVVLLGSTGEGINLTLSQKKEIIEAVDGFQTTQPIMVAVGGINLKEQLAWIEYLENFDWITSYLLVTPLYSKPGKKGQYYWFKKLLDRSSKLCMLYNIPGRAGTFLNLETAIQLADHPNFYAIKEASGDLTIFKEFKQNLYDIKVYSGDDALFYDHARLGSSGLVSVASNVWPVETRKYVDLSLDNELEDTMIWRTCSNSLFTTSNPIPVKRLMSRKNLIKCPFCIPPLHFEDLDNETQLIESDEKIREWYKNLK